MRYWLAIDPGDVHVGWADWAAWSGGAGVCMAGEWTPAEAIDQVRNRLGATTRDALLIVEEFVLYPNRAKEQAGSAFKTSQLIGALKLIAHDLGVPVAMQSATIKKPTRRQLKARGIKLQGQSTHARDAELHLWNRRFRTNDGERQQ